MAWQDRDYHRESSTQRFPFPRATSVVFWLIALNTVIFILDVIMLRGVQKPLLSPFVLGAFSVDLAVMHGQVWRFVTYQFLHASPFHLIMNMVGLFFFGRLLEQNLGARRFLAFYLLCGIGGAAVMIPVGLIPGVHIMNTTTPLIGASGSIYGILVAIAVLMPDQVVYLLFPPIPLKMRTLVLVILGIAVLSVIFGWDNAGGQLAHLGGAALGYLLIKNVAWLNFANMGLGRGPRASSPDWTARRRREETSRRQEEQAVDDILRKVKDQGLQSLSRSERQTLSRASERMRSD